ncbi:MAG: Crp/Fnr family transcriptional regulator [Nocardioides sp.]|nr:Crp/Fnr family transcriptional regulator [Nocardioides sp.]
MIRDNHGLHFVQTVPLFAGLSEETKQWVADAVVTRQYQRDERVYGPGDRTGLFIVHAGQIKVHRLADSGTEQLLRLMSPGDFLGETALLADTTTDHFAVALQPSELCMLERERFTKLLEQHPSVAVQMLQTVSGRLGKAEHMVSDLSGRSVAQRVAQQLLHLADEAGRPVFTLPTTKRELASYLGTTPETLSRRLGTLQETGVIRLGNGQRVELLDRGALRKVASGE